MDTSCICTTTSSNDTNISKTVLNTNINPNGWVGDINYIPNKYPAYSTIGLPDSSCINY